MLVMSIEARTQRPAIGARKRYQYVDIPVNAHRNQSFCIKPADGYGVLGC